MIGPVVLATSVVLVFLAMSRLGAALPWTTFRRLTTAMAAFVAVTSLDEPLFGAILVLPILAARHVSKPLSYVPTWFSDDEIQVLAD